MLLKIIYWLKLNLNYLELHIYNNIKTSNNHINKINIFGIGEEEYITSEVNLIVVS